MERAAEPLVVVGSGASGVHFALSALQKGYHVVMLDVGRDGEAPIFPEDDADQLKDRLSDPVAFALGEQFEFLQLAGSRPEYNWRWPWISSASAGQHGNLSAGQITHGFSSRKRHAIDGAGAGGIQGSGFVPMASIARGGLAEAWTAGAFPYNAAELEDYPFGLDELRPYYDLVAKRIGVSGESDDLTTFIPCPAPMLPPLPLDRHSQYLLDRYHLSREKIQAQLGCYLGRSRTATLSIDRENRHECTSLGRCDQGCPREAIYSPRFTLRECEQFPHFSYRRGLKVQRFVYDQSNRVRSVLAKSTESNANEVIDVGTLVLACGTLGTARIFLSSLPESESGDMRLHGLMDTRLILVPYLTPGLICQPPDDKAYAFHQLAAGIHGDLPKCSIHVQFTALTGTEIHPLVQTLPFDMRTSLSLFRHFRAAAGCATIALYDDRRTDNYVQLQPGHGESRPLLVHYNSASGEQARIRQALHLVRRLLRRLGSIAIPGRVHVRPMGAGIHYAGTLPMSQTPKTKTVSPLCRSHDFENLFVVDGSTLPFLPAKGLTMTLMANAARVADKAF